MTSITIRKETVADKDIFIIDEALSKEEVDAFYDFAAALPIRRAEKDIWYDEFPIFTTEFDHTKFEHHSFVGKKARQLLTDLVDHSARFSLSRAYTNLSNYGDVAYPHHDCPADKSDLTVLYYVNKNWHYKYGGETMFYDNKDSRISILPKPGRFVIFPGNVEHMGSVSSRICKETRITLALKYAESNSLQS